MADTYNRSDNQDMTSNVKEGEDIAVRGGAGIQSTILPGCQLLAHPPLSIAPTVTPLHPMYIPEIEDTAGAPTQRPARMTARAPLQKNVPFPKSEFSRTRWGKNAAKREQHEQNEDILNRKLVDKYPEDFNGLGEDLAVRYAGIRPGHHRFRKFVDEDSGITTTPLTAEEYNWFVRWDRMRRMEHKDRIEENTALRIYAHVVREYIVIIF
jgi:hypothetical protein